MDKNAILQEIEQMSVKDLAELVTMIEKRFNVSAAAIAPVAVASTPRAAEEGEKATAAVEAYNVVLVNPGQKKIQIIKEIKEVTGKGLKECKELVDKLPAIIKEGANPDEANILKEKFEALGAEMELR
jgi:large subunit ribosomal protein L7/L12